MSVVPYWRLVFGALLAVIVIAAPGGLMGLFVARRRGDARVILEARNLAKSYGAFRALDGVSFAVGAGEFVSIIGPNGAGKSTLINLLTGGAAPSAGTVRFKEREVDRPRAGGASAARAWRAASSSCRSSPSSRCSRPCRRRSCRASGGARGSGHASPAIARCRTAPLEVAELFRLADKRARPRAHAAPGRQEAPRRGLGLRAPPRDHPARRAHQRRQHRRQARRSWRSWWRPPSASGCRPSSRSSTTWTSCSATPTASSRSTRGGCWPTRRLPRSRPMPRWSTP